MSAFLNRERLRDRDRLTWLLISKYTALFNAETQCRRDAKEEGIFTTRFARDTEPQRFTEERQSERKRHERRVFREKPSTLSLP